MKQTIANFFRHASGQKSFESARCYEAGLIVVRWLFEENLADARPKKLAICQEDLGLCALAMLRFRKDAMEQAACPKQPPQIL